MPTTSDRQPLHFLARKLDRISPLADEDIHAVESLPIVIRALSAREDIVRQADRPAQACLMLEGWACSYTIIEGGRRQILAFHLPGDFPDLLNLSMEAADFSVATLTGATTALIPHGSLQALTERHAAVAKALWRLTLIEAATFRQWMVGLGRRPGNERFAHLLCELDAKQRALGLADETRCPLPIGQTELADALGITSVHVNRIIKELRDAGLITLKSRTLRIRDRAGLEALANFDPAYLRLDALEPIEARPHN